MTTAYSPMRTDGERFGFLETTPYTLYDQGRVRAYDRRRGTTREIVVPGTCDSTGVGSGQFFYACPDPYRPDRPRGPDRPTVIDLATGAVRSPDVSGELVPNGDVTWHVSFHAVGSRWIAGTMGGYHWQRRLYVEIDTSRVVYDVPAGRRETVDLDRRSLVAPLCPPLARRPNPARAEMQETDDWLPYAFERPFGVSTDRDRDGPVIAGACGSRRETTLCRSQCGYVQLGAGVVTWTTYGQGRTPAVHAYDLVARRAWSWPTPAGADSFVSHAGREVFLSVCPSPMTPQTRCEVSRTRLPG